MFRGVVGQLRHGKNVGLFPQVAGLASSVLCSLWEVHRSKINAFVRKHFAE